MPWFHPMEFRWTSAPIINVYYLHSNTFTKPNKNCSCSFHLNRFNIDHYWSTVEWWCYALISILPVVLDLFKSLSFGNSYAITNSCSLSTIFSIALKRIVLIVISRFQFLSPIILLILCALIYCVTRKLINGWFW